MLKHQILQRLRAASAPLSGEALSQALGVSRAAVWKAVTALRKEGYQIDAQSAVGYRLMAEPDLLDPEELRRPDQVVGCKVICLDSVDSTNDEVKRQAMAGAPAGLVVTADAQTGGRGRRGRSFQSLAGKGLYLSVLLKPQVPPEQISQLTAWAAVAVCRAVERLCPVRPDIKWPNDVLAQGKKLCGILTEMGVEAETGALSYVVVGMGINLSQTPSDFGPELSPIATSLAILGASVSRRELALVLMEELDRINTLFPGGRETVMEEYAARCVTLGREVMILRGGETQTAASVGLGEDFQLLVRWADGRVESVSSGEVSVRGLLGYL